MAEGEKERYTQLLEAQAYLWNQSLSFIKSAALKCAVQLGIPDIIHNHGKPITLDELVVMLSISPSKVPYLFRIMRILVHSGLFTQEEGGFSLTLSSQLLLRNEPFSARAMARFMFDPVLVRPWENMSEWLQNDDFTLFSMTHGKEFWEFNMKDTRFGSLFDEAMISDCSLVTSVLMSGNNKSVFEGLSSIVDVGGGTGSVCKAIAKAFPNLKCTVFDLSHVVGNIKGIENLNFVGGNMFESIPPATAVLLKWITHDWSDEECMKILKNCKEAIPSKDKGGKVIILDMVLNDQDNGDYEKSFETQLLMDMLMMVLMGGKERNEDELAKLFYGAGFSDYKIIPVLGLRSIVEVYP